MLDITNNKKILLFGGDICLEKQAYKFSDEIIKLFHGADYAILNLEAPILKNPKDYRASPKAGPNIFQEKNAVSVLNELNVKYVGGANNHIMDFGEGGIKTTKDILEKNGIFYCGFGLNLKDAQKEICLENSNIAIISASEEMSGTADQDMAGGYSMYPELILDQIRRLKKNKKFIIIYAHGGGEEVPLPSNYTIGRYRQFIDNGADLIIGHHPHVPQGYEYYKNKYIFYSLGNFVHKYFKKGWGILLRAEIINGKLTDYKIIPIIVSGEKIEVAKNSTDYLDGLKKIKGIMNEKKLFDSLYQEQTILMYENYYERYLTGLFPNRMKIKNRLALLIKYGWMSAKNWRTSRTLKDQHMVLHLIRNNSHKEFIETALKIKTGETADLRNEKTKKLLNELNAFIKQ